MASLQQKGDAFYCQFCYQGRRHTVTVGRVSRDEAEAFAGKVVYLLMRIKQKLIRVPPGVDIDEFVIRDGQVPEPEVAAPDPVSFGQFQQKYLDTHRNGAM